MKNLYTIDPLLAANLVFELKIREETILSEQMRYVARSFKQRIKGLTKQELAYITCILLDAYNKQEDKRCFLDFILEVIEQQLKTNQ